MIRDFFNTMGFQQFNFSQFDFHQFTRRLFVLWLSVYALGVLVAVARPMAFFVVSCFDFAPTYYYELMNTLRFAGLWLIPTTFLGIAVVLSNRRSFTGFQ